MRYVVDPADAPQGSVVQCRPGVYAECATVPKGVRLVGLHFGNAAAASGRAALAAERFFTTLRDNLRAPWQQKRARRRTSRYIAKGGVRK